jgi:hypothetical protein
MSTPFDYRDLINPKVKIKYHQRGYFYIEWGDDNFISNPDMSVLISKYEMLHPSGSHRYEYPDERLYSRRKSKK